jgi:hypothetical protein
MLALYHPDGAQVRSFGGGIVQSTAAPITASSHGRHGAFLPDGRSVIARAFSTHRGLVQVQARKFTADGTLDPAAFGLLTRSPGRCSVQEER